MPAESPVRLALLRPSARHRAWGLGSASDVPDPEQPVDEPWPQPAPEPHPAPERHPDGEPGPEDPEQSAPEDPRVNFQVRIDIGQPRRLTFEAA